MCVKSEMLPRDLEKEAFKFNGNRWNQGRGFAMMRLVTLETGWDSFMTQDAKCWPFFFLQCSITWI